MVCHIGSAQATSPDFASVGASLASASKHRGNEKQHHTVIQRKLELPQLKWEWAVSSQTCIFHNFRFPLCGLRTKTNDILRICSDCLIINSKAIATGSHSVICLSSDSGNLKLWKIQVCRAHSHLSWGNSSFGWISVWCCLPSMLW